MYVDRALLMNAFRQVYQPPAVVSSPREVVAGILETIPLTNYLQAAIGRDLATGNFLDTEQRLESLNTALEQSAEGIINAYVMGGVRTTGPIRAPQGTGSGVPPVGGRLSDNIVGNSYDINKLYRTQTYVRQDTVGAIKQEILRNGPNSVPPIDIRVHHGRALIADGHHRFEAFRQLGYDRIPIRYLHKSQLGRILPDGTYVRPLHDLLGGMISN